MYSIFELFNSRVSSIIKSHEFPLLVFIESEDSALYLLINSMDSHHYELKIIAASSKRFSKGIILTVKRIYCYIANDFHNAIRYIVTFQNTLTSL